MFACIAFHFNIANFIEAEAFLDQKRNVSSLQPVNLILNGIRTSLSSSENELTVSFPVYLRFAPMLVHQCSGLAIILLDSIHKL